MLKEDDQATAPAAPPAVPSAADPQDGGSYTRDPATGTLVCTRPATLPPPVMRKTQDPKTGRITKTLE